MRTYRTREVLPRLSSYLVAMRKPFNFDGYAIEFTATPEFVSRMGWDDTRLGQIEFEII